MFAIWTGRRDFALMTAGVTDEGVGVSVERKGEEAIRTESLPAAIFTDSQGRGAATVVKNQSLMMVS